jgi:hypothetical protein
MRRKQKTDPADAEGAELVDEYVERFSANRGLQPTYPRLAIGMMPELNGWPVRNADGGGNIAYFTSYDAAEKALANSYREFRGIASGRRSATKRKRSYASRSKSGGAKRRTLTRLRHVRAVKKRGYGVMRSSDLRVGNRVRHVHSGDVGVLLKEYPESGVWDVDWLHGYKSFEVPSKLRRV